VASGKRSPLTVAGAAVELDRNTGVPDSYHIPSSLSRMREAIKACSTPVRRQVVNGGQYGGATSGSQSSTCGLPKRHYCCGPRNGLGCWRCQVLSSD
jgi:hypothetical protein